ncbi:hypothetical protein [Jeongeupia chitinilytica]|uniref:Capsular polysaccharide biosynthesis protein n=1 Tax=Jeongeupia chitinilytica TaxID=1041641 RepID=A0ABQ3GV00_9NEIS|nr:hypothetical protein [Jeongeupia chitinilytica]GHD56396.1 capsular polysaccharide biosynthesis protein [Jeongeupia chitinilytica]
MAIASGGGHWVELRRIFPAFAGADAVFASVHAHLRADVPVGSRYYTVRDATRWDKWGLVVLLCQVLWLLLRERPDVIVTTGAAPGYFALRFAKLIGARTIWLDSIANVDELSLSGRKIGRHADLWLTQWPHLASPQGPQYFGAVM